jgi:AraC-like DNA-binding protein
VLVFHTLEAIRRSEGKAEFASCRSTSTLSLSILEIASVECRYRLPELASRLGISSRHLRRVFLRLFDCSPADWLREQRLQAATRLLPLAPSVKEVAHELNFRNTQQFSRDFRLRFGCTPSAWMRRAAAAPQLVSNPTARAPDTNTSSLAGGTGP